MPFRSVPYVPSRPRDDGLDPDLFARRIPRMERATHWESVYSKRAPSLQGWFAPVLQPSLDWITGSGLGPHDPILDAGGGASTLVDHLLDAGYTDVSVLDIAESALGQARERLGPDAGRIHWMVGDVLETSLEAGHLALWHDRAVFHFLHEEEERLRYRKQVEQALRPDGVLILGSFRPGAPPKCSGLPVRHHSGAELEAFFGGKFALETTLETTHVTPGGVEQDYVFVRMRRTSA